jgi:ATP-dependent Clp protease adaptor protein ClpS
VQQGGNAPYSQCIAVSVGSDPTKQYYLYADAHFGDIFNDYPKFAIWPTASNSAYLASYNLGQNGTAIGSDLCAYERDEPQTKRPSMWNIVFYNDDYTPMDFVVFVVTKVFHRSTEDALALTFAVHTQGKGIAGTYTFEVAEQKQCEVLLMAKIEEHPLRVEVERV